MPIDIETECSTFADFISLTSMKSQLESTFESVICSTYK